jgi:hypothetical protein
MPTARGTGCLHWRERTRTPRKVAGLCPSPCPCRTYPSSMAAPCPWCIGLSRGIPWQVPEGSIRNWDPNCHREPGDHCPAPCPLDPRSRDFRVSTGKRKSLLGEIRDRRRSVSGNCYRKRTGRTRPHSNQGMLPHPRTSNRRSATCSSLHARSSLRIIRPLRGGVPSPQAQASEVNPVSPRRTGAGLTDLPARAIPAAKVVMLHGGAA